MRCAAELELLDLIDSCPTCHERRLTAALGDTFGVVIARDDKPIGLWGWHQGAMRFRSLASWDPRVIATNPDAALAATIQMADAPS